MAADLGAHGKGFHVLTFFIAHAYLTTTGHTLTAHIKAVVMGWADDFPCAMMRASSIS